MALALILYHMFCLCHKKNVIYFFRIFFLLFKRLHRPRNKLKWWNFLKRTLVSPKKNHFRFSIRATLSAHFAFLRSYLAGISPANGEKTRKKDKDDSTFDVFVNKFSDRPTTVHLYQLKWTFKKKIGRYNCIGQKKSEQKKNGT